MLKNKIIRVLISGFGAAGATFLLQVVISHHLTISDFGKYAASNSMLSIIGPLAGMGASGLFLRKACVNPSQVNSLASLASLSLLITTSLAIALSTIVFVNSEIGLLVAICFATYYVPQTVQYISVAYAQFEEEFNSVSILQSLLPVVRLIIVAASTVIVAINLTNLALALCIAHLFAFVLLAGAHKRSKPKYLLNFSVKFKELIQYLRESVNYSLNGTLNIAQIQISTVFSIYLFGSTASAVYSAANTILAACYILPNTIFGTYFLPKYHKLAPNHSSYMIPIRHAIASFAGGLLVALGLFVSADLIIGNIYPKDFGAATMILRTLACSLPFRFFSTALGAAILSEQSIGKKLMASVGSILFQAAFVYCFRSYGVSAIACSYIFSELLVAGLYYTIYTNHFRSLKITVAE